MTELLGLDIASQQGPDFPFATAYQEGYRFATPKVSGGKRYRNEYGPNQIDGARAAGMAVAGYHYMFESTDLSGTPEEEFANFRAALGDRYTAETPIGLDVEDDTSTVIPQPDMAAWLLRYQDLCCAEYGRYPVLYLGTYFIARHNLDNPLLTRSPLWLPAWQDAVPAPNFWLPWTALSIWQYASQATVAGRSPIDVDKFFGTMQEFGQLGKPGTPPVPTAGAYGPFGKTLGGGFRKFYEAEPHALRYWGYPLTEERDEGGLTVQWFERARFEWHPGTDPANHDVLLGRVGAEKLGV